MLAGIAVWIWRIEPARRNNRLGVNVTTLPSGEFEFGKQQVFRETIKVGEVATGSVDIRNQTGSRQNARFRAEPTAPEVDRTLRVKLTVGTKTIYNGTIDGLDHWTSDPVPIESGQVEQIDIATSVEREPDGSLQGLGQDVTVSLEVRRDDGSG